MAKMTTKRPVTKTTTVAPKSKEGQKQAEKAKTLKKKEQSMIGKLSPSGRPYDKKGAAIYMKYHAKGKA